MSGSPPRGGHSTFHSRDNSPPLARVPTLAAMSSAVLRHVLPLSLLLASAVGCHRGVRFENQVFSKPGVRYRLGTLPPVWERVKLSGNDLAWHTGETGH